MKQEIAFKIFTIIAPFIAAILTYFFSIRGKRKEVDLEKEKELNTVLANLLNVWDHLTRFESVIEIISEETRKSLLPKEFLPALILKSNFLNDSSFNELDRSIELLKKYDPITYYLLDGVGKDLSYIRQKILIPFFKMSNLSGNKISIGTSKILDEALNDIEDNLVLVAENLGRKMKKRISLFINDYLEKDTDAVLNELDQKYYEMMMNFIPDEIDKPTFEQFKTISDTEEFQQIKQVQLKVALQDSLEHVLEIFSEHPNISIQELSEQLEKRQKKDDKIRKLMMYL